MTMTLMTTQPIIKYQKNLTEVSLNNHKEFAPINSCKIYY